MPSEDTFASVKEQALARLRAERDAETPEILVGTATCGCAAGAEEAIAALREALDEAGGKARIVRVGCLGLCYAEPLVQVRAPGGADVLYRDVTPERARDLVARHVMQGEPVTDCALASMNGRAVDGIPSFHELPAVRGQARTILRDCGAIDPCSIEQYIAAGGYEGLARALARTPEEVIAEVSASGLRGRGGAGFPTGRKWTFCRMAEGDEKYLVCNADEGDPGAFMDRSLLESNPHGVLEGMVIAAYAVGASHGYVYCRAEYPLAIEHLERAIESMTACGLLGDDILGSGFDLHIRVKEGAGAFVCGEETALLASIEGHRGMPRSRPPFPAQKGLFGKPTNINNVETLANVSAILRMGADAWAQWGTEKSRGTKTFALAGKINRTGLIEVPMGIPLRAIVHDIGGGIEGGKAFKAVQTGGPSGGCLPASLLDLPVDYESLAEAGSIMGSGGMVVVDEDTCIVDMARYFIEFAVSESCGKCAPCRLGTRQLLAILTDIVEGKGSLEDLDLLVELGTGIKQGSLCGLGQTAPNPVLTTIRYFRDEYEAHIRDGRCPAGVCPALVTYTIDADACTGCRACAVKCPVDCIAGEKKKPHAIDQDKCIKCGTCFDVCRFDAVVKS